MVALMRVRPWSIRKVAYMQNSPKTVIAFKSVLVTLSLASILVAVSGCHDADEHPSQMVKMRDKQMMDQRKAMGGRPGGIAAPSAPPASAPGQ